MPTDCPKAINKKRRIKGLEIEAYIVIVFPVFFIGIFAIKFFGGPGAVLTGVLGLIMYSYILKECATKPDGHFLQLCYKMGIVPISGFPKGSRKKVVMFSVDTPVLSDVKKQNTRFRDGESTDENRWVADV
jgi:hypothetical protein